MHDRMAQLASRIHTRQELYTTIAELFKNGPVTRGKAKVFHLFVKEIHKRDEGLLKDILAIWRVLYRHSSWWIKLHLLYYRITSLPWTTPSLNVNTAPAH